MCWGGEGDSGDGGATGDRQVESQFNGGMQCLSFLEAQCREATRIMFGVTWIYRSL